MSDGFHKLALPPIGKAALWFAVAMGTLVPLVIAIVAIALADNEGVDPRLLLGLQAAVAMAILLVLLPMWRREVAFDGRELRVKATFYTRRAALSDFDLAHARVLDVREHTEYKPLLKTNGFSLPGFQAGHFVLRNRRKAFCLVTDLSKVLALPHADGRVWLLSFTHPQAVLDILRRATA